MSSNPDQQNQNAQYLRALELLVRGILSIRQLYNQIAMGSMNPSSQNMICASLKTVSVPSTRIELCFLLPLELMSNPMGICPHIVP